jgi:hypothetical protein
MREAAAVARSFQTEPDGSIDTGRYECCAATPLVVFGDMRVQIEEALRFLESAVLKFMFSYSVPRPMRSR